MGYITITVYMMMCHHGIVSKLFRAYGLYNGVNDDAGKGYLWFQSSFELMGYITPHCVNIYDADGSFKALSSLWVI